MPMPSPQTISAPSSPGEASTPMASGSAQNTTNSAPQAYSRRELADVFDHAQIVWRLHHDTSRCAATGCERRIQRREINSATRRKAHRRKLLVKLARLAQAREVAATVSLLVRMQGAAQQRAIATGDATSHQHRFGQRRGSVVHAGVADIRRRGATERRPEQLRDQRLILEDRLQRALCATSG